MAPALALLALVMLANKGSAAGSAKKLTGSFFGDALVFNIDDGSSIVVGKLAIYATDTRGQIVALRSGTEAAAKDLQAKVSKGGGKPLKVDQLGKTLAAHLPDRSMVVVTTKVIFATLPTGELGAVRKPGSVDDARAVLQSLNAAGIR